VKCFIDSNVIISTCLFPASVPADAFLKAAVPPNTAFVSDYSLDETHRVISGKFPGKTHDLEAFLYRALFSVRLIHTPVDAIIAALYSSISSVCRYAAIRRYLVTSSGV